MNISIEFLEAVKEEVEALRAGLGPATTVQVNAPLAIRQALYEGEIGLIDKLIEVAGQD